MDSDAVLGFGVRVTILAIAHIGRKSRALLLLRPGHKHLTKTDKLVDPYSDSLTLRCMRRRGMHWKLSSSWLEILDRLPLL